MVSISRTKTETHHNIQHSNPAPIDHSNRNPEKSNNPDQTTQQYQIHSTTKLKPINNTIKPRKLTQSNPQNHTQSKPQKIHSNRSHLSFFPTDLISISSPSLSLISNPSHFDLISSLSRSINRSHHHYHQKPRKKKKKRQRSGRRRASDHRRRLRRCFLSSSPLLPVIFVADSGRRRRM